MGPTRRLLQLIHLLANSAEGLTLDEMAAALEVNRRTAERMRDIVDEAFALEVMTDDRRKRHRIPDGLRRFYTRPDAAELAALETEVSALRRAGASHAAPLASLLAKVKAACDDREKRKLEPDLDALVRLQRSRSTPGPALTDEPQRLTTLQTTILAGRCAEFSYLAAEAAEPGWRCVVPHGIIHGAISYLIATLPDRDHLPAIYRLDRMSDVRVSDRLGVPADGWDLDAWMAGSFGVWREEALPVVLRVRPDAVERAQHWCFHPLQTVEEDGDELVIRFQTGGLREMAEHLFTWGGQVLIEEPEMLREEMRDRLRLAKTSVRPDLT